MGGWGPAHAGIDGAYMLSIVSFGGLGSLQVARVRGGAPLSGGSQRDDFKALDAEDQAMDHVLGD